MVSEVGAIKVCGQKRSLTNSVLIVSLVYLTLDQPKYVPEYDSGKVKHSCQLFPQLVHEEEAP